MGGWWMENKMRMVQFNLRQNDAAVNTDELVEYLAGMHANTVMIGAGGIVSYYPSQLPFAYVSPYLGDGDMLGDVIEKCHQANIRVITRFDFSKVHESIALDHPDWLYLSDQGEIVNYHGMVHACICGEYQQEHAIAMLRECLGKYPVDGLYINMFGFTTFDYDGVEHGICQCDNCRRLFGERTGLELPKDEHDPAIAAYRAFQDEVIKAIMERVTSAVKEISPDISICTHDTGDYVNMTHTESNYALGRALPYWLYSSSDNCRLTNDNNATARSANCVINAADIFWRFMGVSPALNKLRLWQNLASGGQPEWCIVGTPRDYPEDCNEAGVRDVFSFHEQHESLMGVRESLADIALVRPDIAFFKEDGSADEYRGLFQMLKEGHYEFDEITEPHVGKSAHPYRLMIFPGSHVDAALIPKGTAVLATGGAFGNDPEALERLFGAKLEKIATQNRGAYIRCEDEAMFGRVPNRRLILINGTAGLLKAEHPLLPYVAPGIHGPVEISNYGCPTDYCTGALKETESGCNALISWEAGRLYFKNGFLEHRDIILDLIDHILGKRQLVTNAPDMVEIFYDGRENARMIQFVNLTGYNGRSVFQPLPISEIHVTVPALAAKSATELRSGETLPIVRNGDTITITLPLLTDYAAILIDESPQATEG
ncbi:MAG: family 10 glycosylhydrolase [Clostridiales bacterium]|nr:family 10 glycosylhydrolase [Clostridiales bacterium]